ncbi:MAG TPA: winged helix-turn-helix domain-containing protein [Patescibacteria group bacterium]|nr:winged helix-turn-helix domain-containing protein [Patescibacteria group bacterium]
MDGFAGNAPAHLEDPDQSASAEDDQDAERKIPNSGRVRFGAFEANLRTRKLYRGNEVVRLQEKPFQVLTALLERAGSVVTREEIRARVWPDDDYLDFDGNLNTALNKLRRALGDLREQPAFIRTIPRTGYLFIAPVAVLPEEVAAESSVELSEPTAPIPPPEKTMETSAVAEARHSAVRWTYLALGVLLCGLGALTLRFLWPYSSWASRPVTGRAVLLVLPIESPGGDSSSADFADGLSDALITRMSGVNSKDLGVIARTTAAQYRNAHKTAEQIGRELHVDYLLEGTVRRDAQRERVFLWLVRTSDQAPVWAETYDRGAQGALSAEDEISAHVAEILGAKFFGGTAGAALQPAGLNPEAREDYLRGRYFWNRLAASDLEKALSLYQSAIRKEPAYAEAYVGVAETYAMLADQTVRVPEQMFRAAREAAQTALEHDPALSEAHAVLGAVAWQYDHDWARADAEFARAIHLSPSDATARQWHGDYLAALGRFAEANREMEAAHQLDPLSRVITTDQGYTYYLARDYSRAVTAFRAALELDPSFYGAHIYLAWTRMQQGNGKEAAEEWSSLMDLRHSPSELSDSFRRAAAKGDTKAMNRWILERQLKRRETGYSSAWRIATGYAALGEKDKAFEWMEKAIEEHDPEIARLRVDPMMDPLRSDPRFQDFLARLNLR